MGSGAVVNRFRKWWMGPGLTITALAVAVVMLVLMWRETT